MKAKILFYALPVLILPAIHLAGAQQSKVYRVGVLVPGAHWYVIIGGFRAGLKELGLEEGKQLVLEIRDTKGDLKAAEEAASWRAKQGAMKVWRTTMS